VLSHLRVLELGSSVAGSYCAKMFADFGAEVVKVEPPGGDPLRRSLAPLLAALNGEVHSGTFAWLNTNKRSVEIDLESEAGAARVLALAADSDVVVDGRPPAERDASRLRDEMLRNVAGDLVVVVISSFGESGPYRDFAATESVCRALAGTLAGVGAVEGPPVIANAGQAGVMTGVAAFIAAAAGVYGRKQGARRFSISMQEMLVHTIAMDTASAWINGRPRRRFGINRFGQTHPASIYRAREGWISATVQTPEQWRVTCEVLGKPELASDARFATGAERAKRADELDAILSPLFAAKTAEAWFEIALRRRLAFAIVPSMKQLLEQRVHRERGAFVPVSIGGLRFEAPVLPHRLMRTPPAAGGIAPLCGEHDRDYPASMPSSLPEPRRPASAARPLEGLRIVDITMGWAGPLATRLLADLGADIVKVEACSYPDWWRGLERSERWLREKFYEKSPVFNSMNVNKRAITLDLTSREGAELFRELVKGAHAVIDNYAADVLPRLGLDYQQLQKVNPALVMLSMPAFASEGTWSECRGYGSTLEPASGLPSITGQEGGPPTMSQYAYADPYGGFNAAAAALLALLHQQRTGEGQFIEMAHVGGMLVLVAPGIIEQSALGRVGPRLGNRHPFHVPHGAFPCRGDDQWIVIAVMNDAQWRALCEVMERRDLAEIGDRRASEDAIEAAVIAWSRDQNAEEAMLRLQAAGVPAGRVLNSVDVLSDAHLTTRGFWQTLVREHSGRTTSASVPFREGDFPYPARTPAPTLGQHNQEILGGELKLSEERLNELASKHVIGTEVVIVRKAA